MFTPVCYPCCRGNFCGALLDPHMIIWETTVSVAILVSGIIGLTTLFPHYPTIAYTLIGVGAVSTFIALLRVGALKYLEAAFQKAQEEAMHRWGPKKT